MGQISSPELTHKPIPSTQKPNVQAPQPRVQSLVIESTKTMRKKRGPIAEFFFKRLNPYHKVRLLVKKWNLRKSDE